MIDWWPWWITTAVALPLAAVALVVALRVTRRAARAALVAAGLIAVGLGVASPFVMGDSMGSGPQLTAQEFARRADANCRDLNSIPAAKFGQPAPTPNFARKLDAFMPHFWDALDRQRRLRPPADEQETATRWMNAMRSVGHDFEGMSRAAARSDSGAFGTASERLSADVGVSLRLSKALGETYCFQG